MTKEEFNPDDYKFPRLSSIDFLTQYTREERFLLNMQRSRYLDKIIEELEKKSKNENN